MRLINQLKNPNSRNWILRIARITERSHRSIYSYLFGDCQYSKFFELAVENVFTDILDEQLLKDQETDIDFDAENFDPFNVGSAPDNFPL